MKKLMSAVAVMVAVIGFSVLGSSTEAKADYRTLHGVADIIHAVSGGYNNTTVYYEPYPVYYERSYRPVRRGYYREYYPRRSYYRSSYRCY